MGLQARVKWNRLFARKLANVSIPDAITHKNINAVVRVTGMSVSTGIAVCVDEDTLFRAFGESESRAAARACMERPFSKKE